ncbi:serine/threonine-protein kinase Nek1-like [Dendronephthya gigantea]|uniref:serine/threonine-protein kinase Nek1-like n=1 Tax=Dendronephthya gigantea TaxID=151771 RepID=UPI00106B6081|nr:serine/threonine-protein kinase Nek1-like [Dendronephthya gigantea]
MENYDIVSTIGRGGSGKVFLVRSKKDQRQYALKQIILNKSNTRESVLKEARILSKLKHPHIVTCNNFFFDDLEEHLYIVQDYCDGGNLQDKIFEMKEKNVNIKEDQLMQWFVQVTMAVQHIHANKILHRDLKTQNIFLTKRGLIKIGDFGIAKVMENTLDMAETCCGTPCYLSPELCQDVPYTSKADIWALGCLLYELCSLRPAFSAGNIVSLFYKIVSGNVEPIPSVYSQDITNLISQIMSKNPEDRPSAGAILNIPFVKDHLAFFIEGKKTLKEQQLRPIEDTRSKSPNGQACSARLSKSPCPEGEPSFSEYPDDFEASSSDDNAEYSDDFDEVDGEESLKEPIAAKSGVTSFGKVGVNVESYSDDEFEQDSDCESSLQDILASAKAAQDIEVLEETVEDNQRPASSCRDLIKEECINVLGEKGFYKVKEFCQNKGITNIEDHPGQEFEKISDSDRMESCFLVNELFMLDKSCPDN